MLGLHFLKGSFLYSGLRDCCRSIRIGKILVESDVDTHEARVVYARFPEDVKTRKVILMYPIMSSGNTVIKVRLPTHQGRFTIPLIELLLKTFIFVVGRYSFEGTSSVWGEYCSSQLILHSTCRPFRSLSLSSCKFLSNYGGPPLVFTLKQNFEKMFALEERIPFNYRFSIPDENSDFRSSSRGTQSFRTEIFWHRLKIRKDQAGLLWRISISNRFIIISSIYHYVFLIFDFGSFKLYTTKTKILIYSSNSFTPSF